MRTRPLIMQKQSISGAYWTALARLTRELHPLRFSQVILFACDGSWSRWDHFNARTRGQVYHYTDMRVIASQTCHGLFVRSVAARPIPPSSRWGHGLPLSARLSLPGRIPNVSSRPIQFPDCRQPAQARLSVGLCRLAIEMRLKLRRISRFARPGSLRAGFSVRVRTLFAAGETPRGCPKTPRWWAGR